MKAVTGIQFLEPLPKNFRVFSGRRRKHNFKEKNSMKRFAAFTFALTLLLCASMLAQSYNFEMF